MKKQPKILITNDDSIYAPGIKHLWNAIKEHSEPCIVAPKTEQSGVGLGITFRTSLHIEKFLWDENTPAWSVSGTPADCVKVAASVLLQEAPDLIISGINKGLNAGRTVLYSGTIGGVIEGILRGIPGIAFSSYDIHETEYALFEPYIPKIVDFVLKNPLPAGTLLNVNFPSMSTLKKLGLETVLGIKLTRQGRSYWVEQPECRPEATSYMINAKLLECVEAENSDMHWLEKGYISCVPIHVDELTDWRYIKSHKELFDEIEPTPQPSFQKHLVSQVLDSALFQENGVLEGFSAGDSIQKQAGDLTDDPFQTASTRHFS